VIVNHSHRFIFVHVPKAAGTSVSELFSQFSTYRDLEVGGTELGEALQHAFKRRFGLTKHATATEIRAVVGQPTWDDYTRFAFVRDPYARAQSTFHFLKRWHGNKEMKRLEFMDDLPDFRSFVLSDAFRKQKAHRLLWPQVRWLQDDDGRFLVDHIGRLETIDDDIRRLLVETLKLTAADGVAAVAPKKNRSESTDAALIALLSTDAEVEQRIHEVYREDFEAFAYPRFDAVRALQAAAAAADAAGDAEIADAPARPAGTKPNAGGRHKNLAGKAAPAAAAGPGTIKAATKAEAKAAKQAANKAARKATKAAA